MRSLALVLTLIALQPAPAQSPADVEATTVTGTVELSPNAAYRAALVAARDEHVRLLRQRGSEWLQEHKPIWLPPFAVDRALDEWLRRQQSRTEVRPLDRSDRVRDHGFGKSWQTTVTIAADARDVHRAESDLRRALRSTKRSFLVTCGGTVLFWGLLSLLTMWFDRLTRGYMTWRLRVLAIAVGTALPSLAFLA